MLSCVEAAPNTSCRTIEKEMGVKKSQAHAILKRHKFKPYKAQIVHHLHAGDAERRVMFCRWFLGQVQQRPDFASSVIWSDEAHFSSTGLFNRHNNRFWHKENNNIILERQQQGKFGFSVACFILGTKIIYKIYNSTLTANRYLETLNEIIPQFLNNVPLAQLNNIYFQQDGAPAHNAQIVREFLNNEFEDRWIGTNGPQRWPARSPDLSILDFFLWGYLRNKVYCRQYRNVQDLKLAVENAFSNLEQRPVIILNSLQRISKLCQICINVDGGNFEHLI